MSESRGRRPMDLPLHPLSVLFGVLSLVVTAVISLLAASASARTNHRLLERDVGTVATAVANVVPTVQAQLVDAVMVAAASGADPAAFRRFVTPKLSSTGPFVSMSLWVVGHGAPRRLASVGPPQRLTQTGAAGRFLSSVHPSSDLFLTGLFQGAPTHLGYAEMPPGDLAGLVVYAERRVPITHLIDQTSRHDRFALYLGSSPDRSHLLETTASRLPLSGDQVAVPIPFGNTTMTLVGARTIGLAGPLTADLAWIVFAVGLALAVIGTGTVEFVTRRRLVAIALAAENQELYFGQRRIALELQEALLPEVPVLPGLEVVTRYRAGVHGTEVGGDWYDVVATGEGRCVVVVGDVSGRGLRAASVMASLRFALRAYLLQGDQPDVALDKLRTYLDASRDHRFATVVVAQIEIPSRRMTLVSAGHPLPLVVGDGTAEYVHAAVQTPIGVSPTRSVAPDVLEVAAGSELIFFSDGLVERVGEPLDVGLDRLRACARQRSDDLASHVEAILNALVSPVGGDDTVIVGLRWTR